MTTNTPRMRFPSQALAELKQADPRTPVTLNMIRSLIRRGVIPYIEVGRIDGICKKRKRRHTGKRRPKEE